jgi:uncharacterized Zn finger protein (UPF0148 family)
MTQCPLCGSPLLKSNLTEVFACSACSSVFSIKKVVFQTPLTAPPVKKEEKSPIKDLTNIPKSRKIVVEEPVEEKGEVEDEHNRNN